MSTIPSLERIESQSLRRQQFAFAILTLFVIAVLLLLHLLFLPLLGEPSPAVVLLLSLAFLAKIGEAMWLQRQRDGISPRTARMESILSIVAIFMLAAVLALLVNRDDAPYFVLLVLPILQCAYNCRLLVTGVTILSAIGMMFGWIEHYFRHHPPARPTEYLEVGMISVMFAVVGPLVWFLVHQLKLREAYLHRSMRELEAAREKIVAEEKLAAVGRLASGIAHEIRNPVAMIASSLATASFPGSAPHEREEMFAIAAREARRLENLTSDFLNYARPSRPQRTIVSLAEIAHHIADVTRLRAADRCVEVRFHAEGETTAEADATQMEAALLNLALNALDETPAGGHIEVRVRGSQRGIALEVENSGKAIPEANLPRVFEPFFTTKPDGTGLGLAIARGIAVAHGGDLAISANRDGSVVFTMSLPWSSLIAEREEACYGQAAGR